MAIVANLTLTPIPASDTIGGLPLVQGHGLVTAAGGAGTYSFNHGLGYKPTFVMAVAQLGDAVAPTATNALVAHCAADDTATIACINVAGNGSYEVWFG